MSGTYRHVTDKQSTARMLDNRSTSPRDHYLLELGGKFDDALHRAFSDMDAIEPRPIGETMSDLFSVVQNAAFGLAYAFAVHRNGGQPLDLRAWRTCVDSGLRVAETVAKRTPEIMERVRRINEAREVAVSTSEHVQ